MHKFNIRRDHTAKQNYTCLTVKELEELLGKEASNSKIPRILGFVSQWRRLLLSLCLVLIITYVCGYFLSLKREIAVLRRESTTLRNDILNLKEENAGLQKQLDEKQPPVKPDSEEISESAPQDTQNSGNLSTFDMEKISSDIENPSAVVDQNNGNTNDLSTFVNQN